MLTECPICPLTKTIGRFYAEYSSWHLRLVIECLDCLQSVHWPRILRTDWMVVEQLDIVYSKGWRMVVLLWGLNGTDWCKDYVMLCQAHVALSSGNVKWIFFLIHILWIADLMYDYMVTCGIKQYLLPSLHCNKNNFTGTWIHKQCNKHSTGVTCFHQSLFCLEGRQHHFAPVGVWVTHTASPN